MLMTVPINKHTSRLYFLSHASYSETSKREVSQHVLQGTRKWSSSQLKATPSSDLDNDNDKKKKSKFYVYKDDCFGFITFLAGIASQDFVFTTIFVSLSLGAEVLARSKVLPPDPKRPSIVDRKVARAIAILTLLLTTIVYQAGMMGDGGDFNISVDHGLSLPPPPPDSDLAQRVQLAMCIFSAVTAFGDIRWRDRFDYGPDDQVV